MSHMNAACCAVVHSAWAIFLCLGFQMRRACNRAVSSRTQSVVPPACCMHVRRAAYKGKPGPLAAALSRRNTTKPAAQKLAAAGAELVAADMNDEAALAKALEGAWAVFAVTNFW